MKAHRHLALILAALSPSFACLFSVPTSAIAQDSSERVAVHGFGEWAYGKTNGNQYLVGDHGGRYDDASLALNVVASVTERLRIVGEAAWHDNPEGAEAHLHYSFAEWTFSDKLKLRAGKVKQPFGISGEVFDVGTLRPFFELPQSVYGPTDLVGESYKGIGFTGYVGLKGGWGLTYDLYGGGQELEEYKAPANVLLGIEFTESTGLERTRNMVGGRVVAETPVLGLLLGASSYTGHELGSGRRTGVGAQVEYLAGPWSVRSEFTHETVKEELVANASYVEVAYHIDPHWQIAGQYDRLTTALLPVPEPAAPSLLHHEEVALGLNYWWNPNFVFKLSFHHVDGNRFAGPDPQELAQAVASGTLQKKTNLVLFGAQFSF
jgi:hypothetical protein